MSEQQPDIPETAGFFTRKVLDAALDRLREHRLEPSPFCLPPGVTINDLVAELRE